MNDKLKKRLLDLKARQCAGEHLNCPRCGKDTMNPDVFANSKSQYADVLICASCGQQENGLAIMNNPLPMYRWAALQPDRPESDFKARSAKSVWEDLSKTQKDRLTELYGRYKELQHTSARQDALYELRFEALETCPGMTELSLGGRFEAVYATADGDLKVFFREVDDALELRAYPPRNAEKSS